MNQLARVLAAAFLGFVVAALVGYALVTWLLSNPHDRSVEAVMPSVFFAGPLGALLAGTLALFKPGA